MKKPTNHEELRKLLKETCGRTDEQIDAIIEFGKLSTELKDNFKKKNNVEQS